MGRRPGSESDAAPSEPLVCGDRTEGEGRRPKQDATGGGGGVKQRNQRLGRRCTGIVLDLPVSVVRLVATLELPDGGASCQAEEAAVEGTRDAKRSNGTAEDAWAGLVMAAVGRRARQVALDLRSRRSGTKKQV